MNKKIQLLRALAIFAVVMIHTSPIGKIAVLVRPFVNFAVALFIFLSGYLTNVHIDNIKKFYKKRILRVMIPYLIWSVVYTFGRGNKDKLLFNIITTSSIYTFYYIAVYVQLVLVTPLIVKLANSRYKWCGWFISPTFIIIIRYILFFTDYSFKGTVNAITFMVWFNYFYLGIILGNNIIEININSKKLILICFITEILQIIEGVFWYNNNNFDMATTQVKFSSMLTSISVILLLYLYIRSLKLRT